MDKLAGGLFGDNMWGKLATNPETQKLLADPEFVKILQDVQKDPSQMSKHSQDPRMMKVFTVLLSSMATDFHSPDGMHATGTAAGGYSKERAAPSASEPASRDEKKARPDFSLYPEEERAMKEAEWEKEAGNAAYKAKNFELALQHYEKAMELDPNNMTVLTNRAAVKMEMNDYDGCISDCEKAIKDNKEKNLRTDYKIIARAYARIGNALMKQEKYQLAAQNYEQSVLEFKDTKIQDKLLEAKRMAREEQEKEYFSTELSEKARKEGNDAFKKGDYPEAIKLYTEAIKRNPKDPAAYSNRAAAYTKLGEFPHGLKDCERALELDPKFVRTYVRKASIHFYMKEYHKCLDLYQKGLAIDPNNQEMKDGLAQTMMAIQRQQSNGEVDESQVQHAMQDPEIQSILMDPMVQSVLKQLSEDPSAANHVMRNPDMARKINKLIAAGILKTG
eukprot:CAMPEP_0184691538 /NCGR_PEP_ID=MMETSP0313-20130426/364_1 /TAXON_ID=2792 /ORGANISM="Porphyridium aerugineum, Strain SAG 1380-2" /LENGTH=446 /DNA_ID=CAMNT_0027149279 /DNA_START=71 /DNA_END=1411 /DNA_ORIENTATION=+